jgi:hypothetical protein
MYDVRPKRITIRTRMRIIILDEGVEGGCVPSLDP